MAGHRTLPNRWQAWALVFGNWRSRNAAKRIALFMRFSWTTISWVVHAFQKKSTKGISTPRHEIDLVRERIKWLKEMLDG